MNIEHAWRECNNKVLRGDCGKGGGYEGSYTYSFAGPSPRNKEDIRAARILDAQI